jgi:hypothetical protein
VLSKLIAETSPLVTDLFIPEDGMGIIKAFTWDACFLCPRRGLFSRPQALKLTGIPDSLQNWMLTPVLRWERWLLRTAVVSSIFYGAAFAEFRFGEPPRDLLQLGSTFSRLRLPLQSRSLSGGPSLRGVTTLGWLLSMNTGIPTGSVSNGLLIQFASPAPSLPLL